jgi:glycine cleavage system H protein
MNVPADLRYSADHEWVRIEGARLRVGITEYAEQALGDIVFVQLPKLGDALEAGTPLGEVESTKSVSDVFAPVAGVVVEVNSALAEAPERLNRDPYGEGWICVLEPAKPEDVETLLDASAYQALIEA